MSRPSSPGPSLFATWPPAATGLVLVALSLLCFGASAHGADEIGLSRDGHNWDAWEPLFDPETRWVPGDARQERFYIRNQGPASGTLVVELVIDDPDGLVADEQLSLRARIEGDDWQALIGDASGLPPLSLDQGEVVRVDVEASLRWDAPNSTMDDHVSIDVRTTLTAAEEPHDGDDPTGPLPDTGGAVGNVVWVAALTLGSGLALVLRSRRARVQR